MYIFTFLTLLIFVLTNIFLLLFILVCFYKRNNLLAIHATFDWICSRIETREHKLWFRRVWPSYPFSPKAKSRNTMPCEGTYLKCIWEADFRVLNETIEVLERPSIYFNSRHIICSSKVIKAIWFSNGSTAVLLSHLKFNINDF